MTSSILAAVVSATLTNTEPSAADVEAPWQMRWDAPAACPDEPTARSLVSARLNHPLTAWSPRDVDVGVRIDHEPGHPWRATVRITTADGTAERGLEHPDDCDALVRGVALIVAVAVDSTFAPVSKQATDHAVAERARPSSMRPTADWSGHIGLLAGTSWGVLPPLGPELGGALHLQRNTLHLQLSGSYLFSRDVEIRNDPPASASFSGVSGSAVLGRTTWTNNRATIWLGLGAVTGYLDATASGLEPAEIRRASPPAADATATPAQRGGWVAIVAGAHLNVRLPGHVVLTLAVEPFATTWRAEFIVDGFGAVYRSPPGGVRGNVGLGGWW